MSNPALIVGFKQYEHQGLDLIIERSVGGGFILKIIRLDTQNNLLRIELPQNTNFLDRSGQ